MVVFPAPVEPTNGQLLSRLRIQCQVMKDHVVRLIAKGHIIKSYIALQLCVCHRAVCLVRMLPGPHAGTFPALDNFPVSSLLAFTSVT